MHGRTLHFKYILLLYSCHKINNDYIFKQLYLHVINLYLIISPPDNLTPSTRNFEAAINALM